jgi:hypothetical protein
MSDTRNEFSAAEIVDLLSELDKRLKMRGISASVLSSEALRLPLPRTRTPVVRRISTPSRVTRPWSTKPARWQANASSPKTG